MMHIINYPVSITVLFICIEFVILLLLQIGLAIDNIQGIHDVAKLQKIKFEVNMRMSI